MVMTAAVTFSRYFVLGPALPQGTNSPIEKVTVAAYPLADMVLIACLLILVLRPRERTGRRRQSSLRREPVERGQRCDPGGDGSEHDATEARRRGRKPPAG